MGIRFETLHPDSEIAGQLLDPFGIRGAVLRSRGARNSSGGSLATETGLSCGRLWNLAVLQTGDRALRNDGTNTVHTDAKGIYFEAVAAGNGLPVLDLGLPVLLVVFDEQLPVFREQALHACIQAVEFRLDRIRRIPRG